MPRRKIYETVLLRESYREGNKVKKRTIANLSKCAPEEIAAIELALRHKENLANLGSVKDIEIREGRSIGSTWTIFSIATKLGIVNALGTDREGQLALWQVIARVLEQGSRLSAVRLGETYAIASTIKLEHGFCEDDLYKNLSWLSRNQNHIEDYLFEKRSGKNAPNLFLYDVTSSYLEGEKNELADWGYNRDGKKRKKQIVVGLLCDQEGTPITTEVFKGNTQDTSTFASQINKAKERFHCKTITFVGDRGMIKSGQIEKLGKHGYHYITAITKKQIEMLNEQCVIKYELFDENVSEIICDEVRYIFRRNPVRAGEIEDNRISKKNSIEKLIEKQNLYLKEHSRAKEETALKTVNAKLKKLLMGELISIKTEQRSLQLEICEEKWAKAKLLDGCYVIKTDLPVSAADAVTVHQRYKDLAFVESGFRTMKSDLDIRPIHVRTESSTRGHVLVVMLAYMIIKELDRFWSKLYLTVAEGLRSLSTLCLNEVSVKGLVFQQIPEPRKQNKILLDAASTELPKILPRNDANVVTRISRRKLHSNS